MGNSKSLPVRNRHRAPRHPDSLPDHVTPGKLTTLRISMDLASTKQSIDQSTLLTEDTGERHRQWEFDLGTPTSTLFQHQQWRTALHKQHNGTGTPASSVFRHRGSGPMGAYADLPTLHEDSEEDASMEIPGFRGTYFYAARNDGDGSSRLSQEMDPESGLRASFEAELRRCKVYVKAHGYGAAPGPDGEDTAERNEGDHPWARDSRSP